MYHRPQTSAPKRESASSSLLCGQKRPPQRRTRTGSGDATTGSGKRQMYLLPNLSLGRDAPVPATPPQAQTSDTEEEEEEEDRPSSPPLKNTPPLTSEQLQVVQQWIHIWYAFHAQGQGVPSFADAASSPEPCSPPPITLVNAYAATGKTTLLQSIMCEVKLRTQCQQDDDIHRRTRPILYCTYNGKIHKDTQDRFKNCDLKENVVECRTYHSLAGEFTKDRVNDSLRAHGCEAGGPVPDERFYPDGMEDKKRSRISIGVFRRFVRDPSDKYGASPVPLPYHSDPNFGATTDLDPEEPQDGTTSTPSVLPMRVDGDVTAVSLAVTSPGQHERSGTEHPPPPFVPAVRGTTGGSSPSVVGGKQPKSRVLLSGFEEAVSAWDRMCGRAAPLRPEPSDDANEGLNRVVWTFGTHMKFFTTHADAPAWLASKYSAIVCDEAQDMPAPFRRLLLRQMYLPVLLVGDMYQSIYAFAGSVDALPKALCAARDRTQRAFLTRAFRFGDTVARWSVLMIRCAGANPADAPLTCGNPALTTTVHETSKTVSIRSLCERHRRVCVLGRTNCALFDAFVQFQDELHAQDVDEDTIRIDLTEKVGKKVLSITKMVKKWEDHPEKYNFQFKILRENEKRAQELEREGKWLEAEELFTEFDKEQLELMQWISTAGFAKTSQVMEKMQKMSKTTTTAVAATTVTFTTVHAAKGLEWDAVKVLDDFPCLVHLALVLTSIDAKNVGRGGPALSTTLLHAGCACGGGLCRKSVSQRVVTRLLSAFAMPATHPLRTETIEHAYAVLCEQRNVYYVAMTRARLELVPNAAMAAFMRFVSPFADAVLHEDVEAAMTGEHLLSTMKQRLSSPTRQGQVAATTSPAPAAGTNGQALVAAAAGCPL